MLARERQSLIQERLDRTGRVIAAELAGEFAVSEDTIRRDLREMAQAGICERVYGGALASSGAKPFDERVTLHAPQKQALGRATAALLPSGATVFIDAGTTNLAVAEALNGTEDLTVVTNAPSVAAALQKKNGVEIVMIGGRVDPVLGAIIGAKAMSELSSYAFDICVLGACGIRQGSGLMASSSEEGAFKQAIAARSARIIAPVTNDKFEADARFVVQPFAENLVLVVEYDAPENTIAAIEREGVQVKRCLETF